MCLLVRVILINPIFEDGNKRTAGAIIMAYLDMNGYNYNPDNISKIILTITKKNQTNLNQIGRLIKNVLN
jgi:prophage maintenance system killer protein